jgi:hypothetical protein
MVSLAILWDNQLRSIPIIPIQRIEKYEARNQRLQSSMRSMQLWSRANENVPRYSGPSRVQFEDNIPKNFCGHSD